ncbi:MAG: sodium/solute symporter, partial [Bacteroidales bacterium]|nr:sodium/solute symporter [Bacteroidales bacterium]
MITRFSTLDWIVIIAFLALMVYIGFRSSKHNRNETDYALGGRTMNPFMVGVSLFATLMSTLSYLSYPGEMIQFGPVFFFGFIAYPIAYFAVKRFLIPKFMGMNVTSAYEILEIKVGRGTRALAVFFFLLLRFLWMSTVVYATVSTALVPILGIDPAYVPLISIILMAITVLYSSAGGLKAVVTTDVIQTAVMFLGVILTLAFILFKLGGTGKLLDPQLTAHWKPIRWGLDPVERMTVANIIVMRFVWQVCTSGSDQMSIQRYLATKDVKSAAHSYKISLISNACIETLLGVVGFLVMAYFLYNPEAMAPGTTIVGDADTLFPRFILVGLPVGLTGLIAAAIMAAAMSSLSSGLNSSATVIEEDIIKRMMRWKGKEDKGGLKRIKLVSVLLGIAVTVTCFLIPYVTGNLLDIVIKVVNLVVAPLFVLFFMALFVKGATDGGTIAGGLVAFAVAIAISFFEIFGIKAVWIMPFSLIAGIAAGLLTNLIMKHKPLILVLAAVLSVCTGCQSPKNRKAPESTVPGNDVTIRVKRIWDSDKHCAFTSIIRFKDRYYVSFREAESHIFDSDGVARGAVRILVSEDGETWSPAAYLTRDGYDLRDPKLSVTSDGKLMVTIGGSIYGADKRLEGRIPQVSFSSDGESFTDPEPIVLDSGTRNGTDWLWRVAWQDGAGYGVVYSLLSEDPRRAERGA